MLRFDIPPVNTHSYRMQAIITCILTLLYVLSVLDYLPFWVQWLSLITVVGSLIRGFFSPHYCPTYRSLAIISQKLGKTNTMNAGARMFADKMGFIFSTLMMISTFVHCTWGIIPAAFLFLFSFLAAAFGFCAACTIYNAYYRLKEKAQGGGDTSE